MRRFLPLLALLILIPTAQAQAPSATLAAEGLSQKYIATSETQLASFQVALTITNLVCTTSVPLKVTLGAQAREASNSSDANATDNRSFAVVPSPTELTFTIQQGAYGSNAGLPAAKPFAQKQAATIAVTARNLTTASSVEVPYVAEFTGYSGTDCRGSGTIPGAKASGTFRVDFSPTEPAPAPPTPELPIPWSLAWVALAAAVLIVRRRGA